MDDVKIVYHIDEEPTPYLVKVTPSDRGGKVTLGDFRSALNVKVHTYKYFFKTVDDDFGVVKEELVDDSSVLPCANGRIVAWLVTAEAAQQGGAQTAGGGNYVPPPHAIRLTDSAQFQTLTGFAMQQMQQKMAGDGRGMDDGDDTHDEVETDGDGDGDTMDRQSIHDELAPLDAFDAYRARFGTAAAQSAMARGYLPSASYGHHAGPNYAHGQHANGSYYQQQAYPVGVPVGVPANMLLPRGAAPLEASSSLASSDVDETVSFLESEAESSRLSTATGTTTTMSWIAARGTRKQLRRRRKTPISRASSFSSMTDSTMSLNIITVTLNVDTCNFLGISIVGQSSRGGGDGGIYVGSIMKGGAVAQDGRIEPGDMLLEVNGVSFECMTNDEAVRVLREAVSKPGPITLVVAKCWDAQPSQNNYFAVPKQEPVRPIDPRAWIAHTQAAQQIGVSMQSMQNQSGQAEQAAAGSAVDPFSGTLPSASLHSSVVASNAPGAGPPDNVRERDHHHAASTIIDSVSTAMEFRGGPPRMPAPPMQGGAQPPMMRPPFGGVPSQLSNSRPLPPGMYATDPGAVSGYGAPGMLVPGLDGRESGYAPDGASVPMGLDGEPDADGELVRLTTQTELGTIVQALAQPDSGLEIRDRIWLKITIHNAFIGSDLVDWLYTHVEGLTDRREAKKLAAALIRARLIRHTVNKSSFSEKCYYVITDSALRYAVNAPANPPASVYSHPTLTPSSLMPGNGAPPGMGQYGTLPLGQQGSLINDPALDEIDSVSDIAQQNAGTLRWQTLPHAQATAAQRQRDAPAQSAAQALQQAYANAPVQPGAAGRINPYARYVSNPLFTAQTQQYAAPNGSVPNVSNNGPPPTYVESQLTSMPGTVAASYPNGRPQPAAYATATLNSGGVQFSADTMQPQFADRDHAKTPAALSLTPSMRSAAADNCVCLKPIKSLLGGNDNGQLQQSSANVAVPTSSADTAMQILASSSGPGPSGSNAPQRGKDAGNGGRQKPPPPVPVRSSLPPVQPGGMQPRSAPTGYAEDALINGDSASASSSSSSTVSSGEHAVRRVAVDQSQAVAMMSHFANAASQPQGNAASASGTHALYTPVLTQIATA